MILYEGTTESFNEVVTQDRIADIIAEKFRESYLRDPGESEHRSWDHSLKILNKSFINAKIKDCHLLIEYELPYSSQRIDVIVFGNNKNGVGNVVILELKQWSNENVTEAQSEGNVIVNYGKFKKEQAHPSLQVQGYYFHIKDFIDIFDGAEGPELSACAYVHNYSKTGDNVLFSDTYAEALVQFPLFSKEDTEILGEYLHNRLQGGGGRLLYERFANSNVRPSKKLLDHTSEMINNRQIFNLIDEQISTYNDIMYKAQQFAQSDEKSVVIVKGGPGTGKSVIALEVMGELMRQGRTVLHATGSSAFTKTLRNIVGARAKSLFKFFNSFISAQSNAVDVLVCDESHRIRQSSMSRYTPKEHRKDTPQIDELIHVSKLGVFFIDEFQIVRPNETGSVQLILDSAKRAGIRDTNISIFGLTTQFRCSGSASYLQWINKMLQIGQSDISDFDMKLEFKIFDDPLVMKREIDERNKEKNNSARIAAGFCWPWSDPRYDGSLVNDVQVGDFSMPWERKDQFWKWATDESGMEQVGTVYTAQGFEFDYIGIIFGEDLVYDTVSKSWKANTNKSFDTMVTRNNHDVLQHFKNVYRVLLSRAHKGVYVYFMNKETENYFRSNLRSVNIH